MPDDVEETRTPVLFTTRGEPAPGPWTAGPRAWTTRLPEWIGGPRAWTTRPSRARTDQIATSSGRPLNRTTTSCGLGLDSARPQAYLERSRRSHPRPPRTALRRPHPPVVRAPGPASGDREGRLVAATRGGRGTGGSRGTRPGGRSGDGGGQSPDGANEQRDGPRSWIARRRGNRDRHHRHRPHAGRQEERRPPAQRPLRRQLRRHGRQGPPGQGPHHRAPLDPPGRPSVRRDPLGDPDAVIANERGKIVFEQKDVEVPKFWSQLATNVVVSKYFRGHVGTPERETSVKQLIDRVVNTIAGLGGDPALLRDRRRTSTPSRPS